MIYWNNSEDRKPEAGSICLVETDYHVEVDGEIYGYCAGTLNLMMYTEDERWSIKGKTIDIDDYYVGNYYWAYITSPCDDESNDVNGYGAWIETSFKLPKEGQIVFVLTEKGNIWFNQIKDGKWIHKESKKDKFIQWTIPYVPDLEHIWGKGEG